MPKILITNLYGKHNLGDYAILNTSLEVLKKAFPMAHFTLLFVEDIPELAISSNHQIETGLVPYGYAIRSHSGRLGTVKKVIRFVEVLVGTMWQVLLGWLAPTAQADSDFYRYVRQVREADIVIASGGGYLITRHAVGDFFGIVLNVIPILLAKWYRKPILFLPISFGAFVTPLQERVALWAVRNTLVFSREDISTARLKKSGVEVMEVPDLVLLDWPEYQPVTRKKYFVLTFLDFVEGGARIPEQEIAKVVTSIWERDHLECVFIPMASNTIEDNDLLVAAKIRKYLPESVKFRVEQVETPDQAKDVIRYAQFAICNRMHSAIFASTVFTPFVTISYAHKTLGLLKMLGLSEWNVPMVEVEATKVLQKVADLRRESAYNAFIDTLQKVRPEIIKKREVILKKLQEVLQHET